MKKDRIIHAILLIFFGCFVLYTEQFTFAPGATIMVKEFKYIMALGFFSMAFFLILNRNK